MKDRCYTDAERKAEKELDALLARINTSPSSNIIKELKQF
jgi:hypothetical protein